MNDDLLKVIVGIGGAVAGAVAKELVVMIAASRKRRREKAALNPYLGDWYGWYRDPDRNNVLVKETWQIKAPGRVTVKRNNTEVFHGNIEVKNKRIYVTLDGAPEVSDERLFMTIKTSKAKEDTLHGVWLAEDGHDNVVGGHGVLTRAATTNAEELVTPGWLRLGLNPNGHLELQITKRDDQAASK
jgi:hypothetical protein